MKKLTKLVIFCLAILSEVTYSEALLSEKFDTRGNNKAKGIWLSVRYPSGWMSKVGERPNIVRKFVRNEGAITELLMLQVNNVPPNTFKELGQLSERDWADFIIGAGENATVSSIKKIFHEGQPGFIGTVTMSEQRAGLDLYQNQQIMTIFYKNKMILMWCGTSSLTSNKSLVNRIQSKNESGICLQYFNSLVLMDRY